MPLHPVAEPEGAGDPLASVGVEVGVEFGLAEAPPGVVSAGVGSTEDVAGAASELLGALVSVVEPHAATATAMSITTAGASRRTDGGTVRARFTDGA